MPTDAPLHAAAHSDGDVIVIGAGGHAAVVLDALALVWPARHVRVIDDNPGRRGQLLLGTPIEAPSNQLPGAAVEFHVAIGHNAVRRQLLDAMRARGARPLSIVHPRATVSAHAVVGAGSFIAAGAVVGPLAQLGRGCIVNHGATVDHDCIVGDCCHLAPGVRLCGAVTVGKGCLIGVGAVVLPGVSIGANAVVGAGAVVARDVPPGATVKGVPAR